ncbi:hypothetical protein [Geomicrobium sp. JCM 19038]|uniref:hypothetical protein n=1 Tax=Geomicrobium sp. JCM 19038 TaxID=1460635 RepID=UPI00045F1928|nr:hypothetical protein [Geomicrobium sp. JCM 19038]GAK08000.1 hypothetical protein JCM19038_1762 [Geomicrobium sp. JCM 19038]
MSKKSKTLLMTISSVLFIILVFMYFIGYWSANSYIEILFFFVMIASVYSSGMQFRSYFAE